MLTADRRRKEPRTVPRPWETEPETRTGLVTTDNGGATATGLDGMLAFAQMRGAVNLGG